jgi:hypothetical protein
MKVVRIFKTFFFFFKKRKIVAQYKIFNVDEWLIVSIQSIIAHVHKIVIIESTISWGNSSLTKIDSDQFLEQIQKEFPDKVIVMKGEWDDQLKQVQSGFEYIKKNIPECTHCIYIDSDEIYSEKELQKIIKLIHHWKTFNREIRANMFTFFKSPIYQIEPPESFKPMVIFPLRNFIQFTTFRNVNLGFVNSDIWLHHMSYVRKNENDIRNKMITHKNDEGTDVSWYEDVYSKWTHETKNFHPKEPAIFQSIKVLKKEEVLPIILKEYDSWSKKK